MGVILGGPRALQFVCVEVKRFKGTAACEVAAVSVDGMSCCGLSFEREVAMEGAD